MKTSNYADDNTPYNALENDIDAVFKARKGLCNIGCNQISNENNIKLLDITFDNSFTFADMSLPYPKKLLKNYTQYLYLFMSFKHCWILMKAFIQSQFGYCPLIWMFHRRRLNNRINRIHERSLCIVYRDVHKFLWWTSFD